MSAACRAALPHVWGEIKIKTLVLFLNLNLNLNLKSPGTGFSRTRKLDWIVLGPELLSRDSLRLT